MNILKLLKNAIMKEEKETETSHSRDHIASQELANTFIANPEFPFLVSFSRTGSHWLRMLMELYFKKPSLKLLFFQNTSETKDYTCFHTHDLDLKVNARNVIYLYRDPVDTIFSQMSFHGQDLTDIEVLDGWIELYGDHLYKWLEHETFTTRKVILRYENMRVDLTGEFKKLSDFFGVPFDEAHLAQIATQVSKEKIKEKTSHDPRVINLSADYPASREKFRDLHEERITNKIFGKYPELKRYFN